MTKKKAIWTGELKFTNGEMEVSASASEKAMSLVVVDKGETKISVTFAQGLVRASKDVMPEALQNLVMALFQIFGPEHARSAADVMPVELICETLDRYIAASLEAASQDPTVVARHFSETIGLENVRRLLSDLTVEQAGTFVETRMKARSPDTETPWLREHVTHVWEELEKLAAGQVAS